MEPRGVLGSSVSFNRRFKIAGNFTQGQVVVSDAGVVGTFIAQVAAPANNSNSAAAVGIVLDASPPTYSTTLATGANTADRYVNCTYHPMQMFAGRMSNTAAAYAAVTQELDGTILKASGANAGGIVVADTNVGTANYAGGLLLGLTGANPGSSRIIASHSANTSVTVTVPFDVAIAANDTYARLPNVMAGSASKGSLMTNDFKDFMQTVAGATVSQATLVGGMVVFEVEVSDASGAGFSITPIAGYEGGHKTIIPNSASPVFKLVSLFCDHVFNRRL
jgi:hypothetical protein